MRTSCITDVKMLKICRCCLVMDVKMFNAKDNAILELITQNKITNGWVCYNCCELLRKMTDFREACIASEIFLSQLHENGNGVPYLDYENCVKREETRKTLVGKFGLLELLHSNTLAISIVPSGGGQAGNECGKEAQVSVWSFTTKEADRRRQKNYCQGMEPCDNKEVAVAAFVKVECTELLDTKSSVHTHLPDTYHYSGNDYTNDGGSDTDDESYDVPLINVAMKSSQCCADSNRLKDEKSNEIKTEDEDSVGGSGVNCKYCAEIFSKAAHLPAHYRICKKRKEKRASSKRNKLKEDICERMEMRDVIKVEPEDVDEEDNVLCNVIREQRDVLGMKKKKKKSRSKKKKIVEGDVAESVSCEMCSKVFVRSSQLQRHMRTHTGERPFKCEVSSCTYTCSRADDMKTHERKHSGERPYACSVEGCHFTSSYAHHLNRHVRAHNATKEFMCDSCGKKFRESSILKQHQLSAHSCVKPYACEECDYSTAYPNLLKDHQAQVHRGIAKNYVCDECGHSYWRADQLKVHKRVHSGEKPFKCDVCQFATSHSNALKVHKRSHSNERPYICEECAHAFARKDDLKTHMRIHSGDRPYACDRCPYTAAQKSNLKRHKVSHLGIKPFCCDECGKRFAEASSLKMHKRLHAGVRPFKCPHCPYSTSQSGGLKRHLVSHSGEKPFVCHVCGKAFTLIYDLNNHSRIHTGEKPYICDICNFATSHHNALKIHKRSHTGEKPFRCDVCAQCFSRGGDLKTHKRIHTGEKPYACTVCCYTATQASNLKRHMVSHSGKKPFTCGDCGKSFTEAGTLRIHRRTHTGERPYCCHHCAQAFSQAGHLRKHMRLHINSSTATATTSNIATDVTRVNSNEPGVETPSESPSSLLLHGTSNANSLIITNIFKTEINSLTSTNNQDALNLGISHATLTSESTNGHQDNSDNLISHLNNLRRPNNSNDSHNPSLETNNTPNHEGGSHRCSECGQCFSQGRQLTKHLVAVHGAQEEDNKSDVIIQLTTP